MLDLHHRREATVVRMTAPGSLNAALLDGLAAAIVYIGPERPIVLTGAGDVFAPDLDRSETLNRLPGVLSALRAHPMPVVAAVNGDAVGAGFALAEAAGIRIMSAGIVQPAARRYRPQAAVAAGLVDLHCSPAHLVELALKLAGHRQAMAG